MFITTLFVSFSKDGGGSVNVKLQITKINVTPFIFTERNDQCGNEYYSRELLMMGIVVPEKC